MFARILLVGVGGFLGAITRFLTSTYISNKVTFFPLGTLFVNVTGSFILSFIMYSSLSGRNVPSEFRDFATIGFIGAYTTMSTFAFETNRMVDISDYAKAGLNIGLNVLFCLVAVYLGKQMVFYVSK